MDLIVQQYTMPRKHFDLSKIKKIIKNQRQHWKSNLQHHTMVSKYPGLSKKINSQPVCMPTYSCCYLNESIKSRNGFFGLVLIMFHVDIDTGNTGHTL